jgi:hypothetical protein
LFYLVYVEGQMCRWHVKQSTGRKGRVSWRGEVRNHLRSYDATVTTALHCPVTQNDSLFPKFRVTSVEIPPAHFSFHRQRHVNVAEISEWCGQRQPHPRLKREDQLRPTKSRPLSTCSCLPASCEDALNNQKAWTYSVFQYVYLNMCFKDSKSCWSWTPWFILWLILYIVCISRVALDLTRMRSLNSDSSILKLEETAWVAGGWRMPSSVAHLQLRCCWWTWLLFHTTAQLP